VQSVERQKQNIFSKLVILFLFDSNKTHLALDKNSTNCNSRRDGSSNVGAWGTLGRF